MRRRNFLLTSAGVAATAASPFAGAQQTPSANRTPGAHDRIRIALLGCGGMGMGNLRNFLRIPNIQCAALCDVDDSRMDKTQRDYLTPVGQRAEITTRDFRRILDRKDIDAVVIATPDHWHALMSVMACQAGKDVFVQKPLATSIAEGRAMVAAARKYNRIVQVGTQQRSMPHFQAAIAHVKSGALGRIRVVRAWAYLDAYADIPAHPDSDPPAGVDYNMWLGPAPERPFNKNRFHFNFRWFWDYAGGLATDWGAHMIDVGLWGMDAKAPISAASTGGRIGYPEGPMETPDTQQILYRYPEFTLIWEHALGMGRGPEGRDHGIAFHGQDAMLIVDRFGWEVHPETDAISRPRQFRSTGIPRRPAGSTEQHELHFVNCLRTRKRPNSDVEMAHNTMTVCHLGNIALRTGREVRWNGAAEQVIDDPEAQEFVSREYRAPWKLTV
ncbi:MAG TPA: Gfo/Idh/MocA family oxidoreductase [Bryobacteraceae bacterium]|nr:Gfo/Idh/MocA family oxidoreductase [Bryobacteraceae bacterium]